ncbi:MAG: S8 family serine peptidase, partial [Ilumatobacteraceae bacterium]
SARRAAGAVAAEALSPLAEHSQVLRLGRGATVGRALEALRRNPNVEYAEPNYLLESTATSNDPALTDGTLWGMLGDASSPRNQYGSQAAEAWAAGHVGSEDVYVVVIDSGVQVAHSDLAANMWTNPFDPIDEVDNDGNGFVDDVNGWDFANTDNSVYDSVADDHGTHVAGTIGGVGGNGIGVVGVNWDVTMITAKFLQNGSGSTSHAVRAVDYATDLKIRHGLNIVATSNSWGGGGASTSLLDAIERGGDAGILFVAAAGNGGPDQIGDDNDVSPHYPSNYVCDRTASGAGRGWDCVISVASITSNGSRSSFSNYGDVSVDLGAPGSGIESTLPENTYGSYSGTSMATPHVSGAIALCASINQAQTAAELRSALFTSVAPTSSMNGITTTGGRLDVSSMLSSCIGATEPVSGAPSGLTATAVDSSSIDLAWTDDSNAETFHEIEVSTDSCSTFILAAVAGADAESATVTGLDGATDHCFRVRSANGFAGGTTSAWSNTANARTLDPPPDYICVSEPYSWVSTAGGSALGLGDDVSSSQSIGFSFPLYDRSHTSASVGSNGLLGLGDTANPYTNGTIPDAAQPNGVIAAFWDDLNPAVGGSVRVLRTGSAGARRFIASWEGVPHYNVANGVTFQIVLEEATGDIVLQYQDVLFSSSAYDRGASATVGIENHAGDRGTLISRNQATLSNGTAYRCSLPSEVQITTTSLPTGTTGSAYSVELTAVGGNGSNTWSASGLPSGLSLTGDTISGTPNSAGTSTVTVTVVSGDGSSDTVDLQLVVGTPVTVTTSSLAGGSTG